MSTPILIAQALTKRYGAITAVDTVDFAVQPGTCVGFLGPNGAGKTTTIKMIYGMVAPTSGALHVFGLPVQAHRRAIKRRLGVVSQLDILEESASAMNNLRLHGRYCDMPSAMVEERGQALLRLFHLHDRVEDRVFTYSGGMKRRLSIVKGLLNAPELLLLDEPTIGLDPQARHLLWERIEAVRAQGTTILLTTHYMEEAERLCDALFIMDRGRIIASGTTDELIRRHLLPRVENHELVSLEDVFLHVTGREVRE
ncbi:MAG: ABC transporter ATP-binding protein [Deltaproteobacteria bacterium]|nr:ABC transporter ATP-binding protein [Deltaproteobacteria bacterium]